MYIFIHIHNLLYRFNPDNFRFSSDDQELFFTTPEDNYLVHFAKLGDKEPVLYDNVVPMYVVIQLICSACNYRSSKDKEVRLPKW